jgi:hypothetical protein
MAGKLQIKTLGALVRVKTFSAGKGDDRKPLMRQAGFDHNGKPIVEQATKLVNVHRGDPLPADIADGEVERLKALGAVGTPEEVAREGARQQEGAPAAAAAEAGGETVDLSKLAEASDEELARAVADTGIEALTEAAGEDAGLAQRMLDAENAREGEPRKGLVEALEKVTGEGGA